MPSIFRNVIEWREWSKYPGIANENVDLAPASIERRSELINFGAIPQVKCKKRRFATKLPDLIVEFFSSAGSTCCYYDMGALARQRQRVAPVIRASRLVNDVFDAIG